MFTSGAEPGLKVFPACPTYGCAARFREFLLTQQAIGGGYYSKQTAD
jgi:hypothetical protein